VRPPLVLVPGSVLRSCPHVALSSAEAVSLIAAGSDSNVPRTQSGVTILFFRKTDKISASTESISCLPNGIGRAGGR
jgi:hypothetical protein